MSNMHDNVHPIQPSTPPRGDEQKAEKYVNDLVRLIESGKLEVNKTDLSQFNPSSLQSHYRLDLDDFQIEISHSSHIDSGSNSYVIIFNNLKSIADGNTEKAILAYIHLTEEQFRRFYNAAEVQTEKLRKIEDEKRFIEAVKPLDDRLAELEQSAKDIFSEKIAEVKEHNQMVDQHQSTHHEENHHQHSYSPVVEEVQSGVDPWSQQTDKEETKSEESEVHHHTLGSHPATY